MKSLLIHIDNDKYYFMYLSIKELYTDQAIVNSGSKDFGYPNKFKTGQKIIQSLDEYFEKLISFVDKEIIADGIDQLGKLLSKEM